MTGADWTGLRRLLARPTVAVVIVVLFLPPLFAYLLLVAYLLVVAGCIARVTSQNHDQVTYDQQPAMGQPVTLLVSDEGGAPIFDPFTRPGWVDQAIDEGANVQADVFEGPDRVRFSATSDHPLRIVRSTVRPTRQTRVRR